MKQDDAGSAPMLGSQEPVGWVVRDITGIHPRLHANREDAEAFANCQPVGEVVPLFAAPALTDEEREAIANGASSLEAEAMREWAGDSKSYMRRYAATLRAMLERLK